mgnify:CR=1 FL=1
MEASGDGHTDWIVATDEFYASPRLLEMCGFPPGTTFAGRADFVAFTSPRCDTAQCQRDRDARKAEAESERDALARLAQDSSDPQIYAWAYRG